MAFKLNPITGKLDIVSLPDGTAAGQTPFWNASGSKWEHTEVSELVWDDTNKRLGVGVAAPLAGIHLAGSGLLATGTTGGTPVSGAGTRMMWIPAKGAFRAGTVIGTEWDDANVGTDSVSFGQKGIASGNYSVHLGTGGAALGNSAIHFGREGSLVGNYTAHFGRKGSVGGHYSTHFGNEGRADGQYSVHFGQLGWALGDYSWVGGKYMRLSYAADRTFVYGYHTSAVSITVSDCFLIFPVINSGRFAIGTASPATSAAMDLTSTTGALLLPRMTTAQRNALTPVNGMLLYDSTLNQTQTYENGAWRQA